VTMADFKSRNLHPSSNHRSPTFPPRRSASSMPSRFPQGTWRADWAKERVPGGAVAPNMERVGSCWSSVCRRSTVASSMKQASTARR